MSQITKLNYIDAKLGAATQNGQQTTRIIYDTDVETYAAAAPLKNYYEFFVSGAGKSINQTNLPTGKLDSGEAMVIKQINIQNAAPQQFTYAAYIGILNVFVGNQCVVKDFNIGTQWGSDYGMMERMAANIDFEGQVAGIRLLTDIVLPPQVDLKVTIQYPGDQIVPANIAGDWGLQVKLLGYGVLFNAGTSF